jgi:hypothetical protein
MGIRMPAVDSSLSLIRTAQSVGAVIQIVNEYLAQLTPDDYEQLPFDCRPRELTTGQEVSEWAVHLTRCELKFPGSSEAARLLSELASFFREASSRIARIVEQ